MAGSTVGRRIVEGIDDPFGLDRENAARALDPAQRLDLIRRRVGHRDSELVEDDRVRLLEGRHDGLPPEVSRMRDLEAGDAAQRLGTSPHLVPALGQEDQVTSGQAGSGNLSLVLARLARSRRARVLARAITA
jgi:hypothetical protein